MKTTIKSFEIIKEMYEYFVGKYRDLEPKLMICEKEDFDNVETTLKEHELMKEIRITARFDLEQVNKEHKAFEIIKEKRVDVALFDTIMKDKNQTDKLRSYNFWQFDECKLTQDDFNLLKEVLKI